MIHLILKEVLDNHDSDNDKNAQDGVCSSVHKVDTAASEGDAPEGDPSMNKEVVLTEPDQDNELGEEVTVFVYL